MKRITLLVLVAALCGCVVATDGHPGSGSGPEKSFVCHKGKNTLEVSEAAVSAHLKHGDRRGRC